MEEHATGHFLRKISMTCSDYHVLTWGYDGLITLRTIDLKELLAVFNPHHRARGGCIKAITSPTIKYTISIGKTGGVVCSNLVNLQEDPKFLTLLQNDYDQLIQAFHSKTIGFIPETSGEEGKLSFKSISIKIIFV